MHSSFDLHNGDCLEVLRTMADNSVDAVVTDPPYGLAFMGKRWDYDVPSEDIWRECLRVLKPGGHLLAFAGTRTQHRMAVRIEDAGFEIRDMIAWVYGSGFPKSLNVGKAIDKRGGSVAGFKRFRDDVKAAMERNGVSRSALQEALGNYMLSHYLTAGSQPAVPNLRDYLIIRDTVGLGNAWDEQFVPEAEREVIGQRTTGIGTGKGTVQVMGDGTRDITAPATPAAQQWHGWGTALKPALEPITVARKPLIGTVAENVLTWGTGGVNVDGCRVDFVSEADRKESTSKNQHGDFGTSPLTGNQVYGDYSMIEPKNYNPPGRWPANLIHDGSDEVVGLFPETSSGGFREGTIQHQRTFNVAKGVEAERVREAREPDSGSAARFFYCAKASKADRGEGNAHPTVKPTDLMRYLCRLVTPPGGVVLDPFMGSGSTGKGAILEGFRFIGIEREAEYIDIARARIQHAVEQISTQPALDL